MKAILRAAAILVFSGCVLPASADSVAVQLAKPTAQKELPAADFQILAGRYPNWSRLSGCPADKVPYDQVTHILYAGYLTNARGLITNSDPADEANFKDIIRLAHAKGVKVLLSIAGTSRPGGFKAMAAGKDARARFVQNCLKLADAYGLDGIDLAWKFPIAGDGDNQLRLHRELRSAIDARSHKLLFTVEAAPTDFWARHSADESFVLPDYLFVMSFDYARGDSKRAIPNAGLPMVKASLEYYERRGVPKNKLVIGTPFYGRSFEGASALGASSSGKGSGNDGLWPWKDLLVRFKAYNYKILWDEGTESEYAVGNGELITFDGLATQWARARFARANGYGGLAVWDLPNDTTDRIHSLSVALHTSLWSNGGDNIGRVPSGPKWDGANSTSAE